MEERIEALEARVGSGEARISDLESEQSRTRRRLHDLESDRAAIRHLTTLATDVFTAAKKMQDDSGKIIDSAATRAVEKAFGRRREIRWQTAIRISTILGGLGGIGYLLFSIAHG